MSEDETLKNEVRKLLEGGKSKVKETKKVVYDKSTNQFSVKIPKKIAEAAQLDSDSEFILVVKPEKEEVNEILSSHFIIYAKEKTNTKAN